MLNQDPGEAGEQFERLAAELQRKAQRYTSLRQQLDSAGVTERSPGGEVAVTVDGNGVLTGLDLSERTRGMDPSAVSATIMASLRQAQARLREQVSELVQETVGDDPAGNNIVAQYAERFPDPVDGEDAPGQQSSPGSPPRPSDRDDDDFGGGPILR
ncbi:YbaB/EbfC family nucleoid-associated protein [Saccharomonospora piscinae]|uniref:YbaB/EbfC family nucleoid-associated protein n=1 Tax=Saccharomonospora piscinae TaxID=687388 RepID=UPI0004676580|nr:YbaB/EbfC family nucleoid-associated protein [Saccharomonospora piscinae]